MTNAPHLLMGSRAGFKYGDVTMVDHMALDGLTDAYEGISMGESTDKHNAKRGIARAEQDAFGARSHQLAAAAQKNGAFAEEIAPVTIPQRKGDPIVISEDEGVRADTTVDDAGQAAPGLRSRTARSRPVRRRRSPTAPARSS